MGLSSAARRALLLAPVAVAAPSKGKYMHLPAHAHLHWPATIRPAGGVAVGATMRREASYAP